MQDIAILRGQPVEFDGHLCNIFCFLVFDGVGETLKYPAGRGR